MNIYAKNVEMSSRCWSLKRMRRPAVPVGRRIRKKRCHHSVFPLAINLRRHQKGRAHLVQAVVPPTVRAVPEAAVESCVRREVADKRREPPL